MDTMSEWFRAGMKETSHLNGYLRYVLEVAYDILCLPTVILRQRSSKIA
jgi:hypothetical protein